MDILKMSLGDLEDFVGRTPIGTDEDLDGLLQEMDEIVQEEGREFSADDMFKAFALLLEEKSSLEAEVREPRRSSGKENTPSGNVMR